VAKVLCQLPKLQILYYHGNAVSDLKEVETLSRIKTLMKLSLHGNPIDQNVSVCILHKPFPYFPHADAWV